jgi:hypothetical protein
MRICCEQVGNNLSCNCAFLCIITIEEASVDAYKNMYIERTLEPVIRSAAREFPAIIITGRGAEVDIVVDDGTNLIPLEVKLSATPRPAMAAGLIKFKELFGKKVDTGYVIHCGDMLAPLAPKIMALPFARL